MSSLSNHAALQRYASVLVQNGLNVQRDQTVLIAAERGHQELVSQIVEACQRGGAGEILHDWLDPEAAAELIRSSSREELAVPNAAVSDLYERWAQVGGCRISVAGEHFPDLMKTLDPTKVSVYQEAFRGARKPYFKEVANKDLAQWCVAAGATEAWAKSIFPGLSDAAAQAKLWTAIFDAVQASAEDPVAALQSTDELLHARASYLNGLRLSELHFSGPGTDLRIGLTERARFMGGSKRAKNGVSFIANLPTYEVFTTPDYRRVNGRVRCTRPVRINGVKVSGLELEFRDGVVVDFSADEGLEMVRTHLETDPGARRLGEAAIVGIDSPIFQSQIVFANTLFDENAASHIALGNAYAKCLLDGTTMSKEELEQLGCNSSSIHTDIMISDENVDLTGHLIDGSQIAILAKGRWCF